MLRSRFLRAAALVSIAVASISCGDFTGSTNPSPGSSRLSLPTKTISMAFVVLPSQATAKAVRWGQSHENATRSVSALIGSAGGSLSIPDSDFEMLIPEGAVDQETLITVTSLPGQHVAFDMQPHGLRFQKPVQVVQGLTNTASYGTAAGNVVRSAYLAEANEQIGDDDSVSPAEVPAATTLFYGAVPVAQTHIWYLNHFSRYILISGVWMCVEDCSKK